MIVVRLFLMVIMFAASVQQAAAITLFSEDFESSVAALQAKYACSYGAPATYAPFVDNAPQDWDSAQKFAGTYSLKQNYSGSQYDNPPQGGGACQYDFSDQTQRDIWITWYHRFAPNFLTAGGAISGVSSVGGVATKGIYMYMKSLSTGVEHGWVFHYFYGGTQLTLSAQGIKDARGPASGGYQLVPYDTENMWNNVSGWSQPLGDWVCYEANYKLNTPGQTDGQYLLYSTNMTTGGGATLRSSYTNREFLDTTPGGMSPSDSRWFRFKYYRQDGLGDMWYDNTSVTTTRIGCSGTPPPPPPPPPVDTTPPTTPGTPSCTPGENSAACTWTASTDANSPITYSLQYRSGSNVFATGITSTTNSATLTGLSLSTSYDARVIATDPAGNVSTASGTGTFSTTAGGGGSTGAVGIDAVAVSDSDTTLRSSRSWTHTVGTGANRALVVCLAASDAASEANAGASSVTFNGAAMTFIRKDAQLASGSNADYLRTELWRLLGPPSGAGTVVATWAGSPSRMAVGRSLSLTGVSASAPINANGGATGNSTAVSAPLTTSVDDTLLVDCAMGWQSTGLTVGSGQTVQSHQVVTHIGGGGGNSIGMSAMTKATAGADTMDWTQASDYWVSSAMAVTPEVTVPTVEPTITGFVADATGADLAYGAQTPTSIRIITGNNDKGTISSQVYPIASFPAGRFTQSWLDGLSYVCAYPLNASGVQNPSPTAHRCDSLVGIVGALDTNPPVISSCQPSATLPFGTTSHTFSCAIDKPAIGKWGTSNVAYASLTNTANVAALTISGTVTGLTDGSSTPIYVGAASTDALGDEHATVSNTTVTIAVAAAPAADTTRPSDVTGPAVTNLGQVAELNWNAATDNVAVVAYQVYQSTGACSSYTVAGNPVTTTSTQVSLAAATVHCWKVKALDAANNDSLNFSSVVSMTTSGIIDFELPSDMANLHIAGSYSASVLLQWDIGTDNSGTPKALIEQCAVVSGTTCEDFATAKSEIVDRSLLARLTPSTTYCWRGKHSDLAGNVSAVYSNVVCGATRTTDTINAPRNPLPIPRPDSSIRLPATGRLSKN